MLAHYRNCQSDEDYAQFTLYFIRNRKDFNRQFSLADALVHVLESIPNSCIILITDKIGAMIGWGHYRYLNSENEFDPAGEIVFVNSVIVHPSYRGGRLFIQGFRYMVQQIVSENGAVKYFQFCAQIDNLYLNRLYAKFSRVIGQREGYYGIENVYSADIGQLLQYLNGSPDPSKVH
ncbi:GNAT family N-acetyltransferase [Cohnella herbarum]|uniref:GNAT family N-acetyltransferase n=1 Tax=Cohnella herbarum TaxID=2728023 RepID=A0A7Z2VME1_9BACL|nr:GNAT family N-acetyltransferase [Cohnella herbarum]QJD85615.1 GNAT family N-acetyltransferase [Cohnella herbarum]